MPPLQKNGRLRLPWRHTKRLRRLANSMYIKPAAIIHRNSDRRDDGRFDPRHHLDPVRLVQSAQHEGELQLLRFRFARHCLLTVVVGCQGYQGCQGRLTEISAI